MTEYIFRDLNVDIQRFLIWLLLGCNSCRVFYCVTFICEITYPLHITNIYDLIVIHVNDISQIILSIRPNSNSYPRMNYYILIITSPILFYPYFDHLIISCDILTSDFNRHIFSNRVHRRIILWVVGMNEWFCHKTNDSLWVHV